MNPPIPLTKDQKELMTEFYQIPATFLSNFFGRLRR